MEWKREVIDCGPIYSYVCNSLSLGDNRTLEHIEDYTQLHLENVNTKCYIHFNNGFFTDTERFIRLEWKSNKLNYYLCYNSESLFATERKFSIEKSNKFLGIQFNLKTRQHICTIYSYKRADNGIYNLCIKISDKIEISHGHTVFNREERIKCLVTELRYNAWTKAARQYLSLYREKRRKIIDMYILPDLTKIVEKYIS